MPDITFPDHVGENSIAHAMVRAPNAGRVFAHPGGFDDADQAHAHLVRWMTSPPEDHLRRLLDGRMSVVTDMYEANPDEAPDTRWLGDVVTDNVLVHVLTRLGVDPRAALVAMAFHAEEDVVIDDITISPSMIDQPDGTMTIHGYVMLAMEMDILTDRHRIDLQMGRLPDTLAGTIVGRPLRDLVSHRLCDGIDLTIAQFSDAGPHAVIDYDGGRDVRFADVPSPRGTAR
jgi:hypothetical protein